MPIDFATALAAITGAQKSAEADNPWTTLAGMGDDLGSAVLKNRGNFSPKETIIASLISGLIGGIGQNLSNTYKDEQNTIANDQMRSILSGGSLNRADGQSPSVFHSMQNLKSAQDMSNEQQKMERLQRVEDTIAAQQSNPMYRPIGSSGVNSAVKASLGPDGGLSVTSGGAGGSGDLGAPNLLQSALSKGMRGEPLTPEEDAAISAAPPNVQSLYLRRTQQQGVSDRFGQNLDFKTAERGIPGYTNITDAIPGPETIKELRTKIQANDEVKNALQALKTSGDANGFMELVGSNAQMQAALQSSIFNAYRKRTGSGARLEGPEGEMIKAMTPQVLSGNIIGALKAAALGRDQNQFIDSITKFLQEDQDITLFSQGFKANNRPLSFYPKASVEKFGLGGLSAGEKPPISPEEARAELQRRLGK